MHMFSLQKSHSSTFRSWRNIFLPCHSDAVPGNQPRLFVFPSTWPSFMTCASKGLTGLIVSKAVSLACLTVGQPQ